MEVRLVDCKKYFMKQDKDSITSVLARSLMLVVNTGSDSHKYALYEFDREVFRLHLEKEGSGFVANLVFALRREKRPISDSDYQAPVDFLLKILIDWEIISDKSEISSVGIRIVAPGEYFLSHNIVDDKYFARIVEVKAEAPLHVGAIILEIEEIRKILPGVKIVGISDSGFHKTLPEVMRRYAIPEADSTSLGIYRCGYHGISVASIAYKIEKWLGVVPERVIVCHLGSGSSLTALKNGQSFDTSMGFTPLEGLPMGSRVGNIDPGAVIALGQKKGLSFSELEKYFNTECGLLGLSGKTKDVRELLELETRGDKGAKLALDSFVYNIKKYIGSYMAALGGLDLLVFTATIGERSFVIRDRVCSGLQRLGLILDQEKNGRTVSIDGFIHADKQSVPIAVITTDEMGEMVREMVRLA